MAVAHAHGGTAGRRQRTRRADVWPTLPRARENGRPLRPLTAEFPAGRSRNFRAVTPGDPRPFASDGSTLCALTWSVAGQGRRGFLFSFDARADLGRAGTASRC